MSDVSSSNAYPNLLLGRPVIVERESLNPARGGRKVRRPPAAEQEQRLGGRWQALQQALDERRASISSDLGGVDPELVLVIEIVGSVEGFVNAVRRIEGFEYLAEIDEEGIEDDAFVEASAEDDSPFDGSLYLLATNQAALDAVLRLWRQYQADETAPFPHGLARWREVFQLLVDLRRWAPQDRLRGTGAIDDFRARAAAGQEIVPAEIELWFRSDQAARARAEQAVVQAVQVVGGEVLARAAIDPIAYHALLVSLPVSAIGPILEDRPDDVALVRAEEIAFVRPEAQALVTLPTPSDVSGPFSTAATKPSNASPLVAVLDGIPLPAHVALDDRILIDDPDDWAAGVQAQSRQHGTAVASLVIHGDASIASRAPSRRIYIRPVLMPDDGAPVNRECIPHNELAIDLIYRAIVRMKDPTTGVPQGGEVRLVNLSIGDAATQLATTLSPWARLLDYLANRFDLLFIVSAGNHPRPLTYAHTVAALESMTDSELRNETLRLLVDDAAYRRILSPADSVSCLCVGSAHDDACASWIAGSRRDLLPGSPPGPAALPSPMTAAGMGYRRSIKPDLLAPGGRTLFRRRPEAASAPTTTFEPAPSDIAPGLLTATPSPLAGTLAGVRYFHGTSGAAALVSHCGALLLEDLAALRSNLGDGIDPSAWSVLTKALLVHSCALSSSAGELRRAFGDLDSPRMKDAVSRFYGYGVVDTERLFEGHPSRATAIGWGEIGDGEGARFEFPLPPSLAGVVVPRRLIITVAYFPPIRPRDRRHRAAELYVIPDKETLRVSRVDADWRTVKRGSVQHEILSGQQAAAFVDGAAIVAQVNCRSLVNTLKENVRFGLAVTLEAEGGLPIHAEVATRLQARAQARIRP